MEEALEEGIALVDGAMLERAEFVGGDVRLACRRVRFVPGERHGQFTLVPFDDGAFELRADAIVTSIGQDPDLAALDADYPAEGPLLAVDASQATGVEDTWAGGDVASMARFVTDAIGQGKRAAFAIDQALRARTGEPPHASAWRPGPAATVDVATTVALPAIATHGYPPQPRAAARRLDAKARLATGDEVQLPLDVEQALAETTRCFSCGTCIRCDTCVVVCPDLAVVRTEDGYRVLGDYCKGCGLCVKECPTGSMDMVEEAR